ncbi:MAG TPA: peptidoglycan editing factor PgeF [Blastocatellia bacterium]|nr:peptidoglycan editing factor PgeF [Blastocatellia bacterium]
MDTIIETTNQTETDFKLRTENNITFLVCERLEEAGFKNAFSTRRVGVSSLPDSDLNLGFFSGDNPENVLENRRMFLQAIGAESWPIVTGKQVHSADLWIIRKQCESLSPSPSCDGVLSRLPGILAVAQTADCTPVLIADPVTGAFAAVHAGWRGTASRIVERAVATLKSEYSANPGDCRAAIGPAAGSCCYEVGQDVISQFKSSFSYADELFSHHNGDKANLDVPLANVHQLIDSGLSPEHIYKSNLCTMCRTDLFFSYRKEKNRGAVGRLLSVIGRIGDSQN